MLHQMIGILVVVAAGVLVFPFLLNHYDHALKAEITQAPPFPSQESQDKTIAALADSTTEVLLAPEESKLKKAVNKVNETKHAKLGLKNSGWVIQLGSYKDKLSALSVVNQLRLKGYNA